MKSYQDENTELQRKLRETVRSCEDQKFQFRTNLEELRLQLEQVMGNRDQVLQMRTQENANHDEAAQRYKTQINQLEEANKQQEQVCFMP